MKTLVLIPALFLIFFSFINPDENYIPKGIKHVKTIKGGCDQNESTRNATHSYIEPAEFSINKDSLSVFVQLEYICCARFDTKFDQKDDTLVFLIKDICKKPFKSCYCRCECVYTFDFKLINYDLRPYNYKLLVYDPREDETFTIKTGSVDLSKL